MTRIYGPSQVLSTISKSTLRVPQASETAKNRTDQQDGQRPVFSIAADTAAGSGVDPLTGGKTGGGSAAKRDALACAAVLSAITLAYTAGCFGSMLMARE